MARLRIAVLGAGMIAQLEHIPNLLRLTDLYELIGVSDPSPGGRSYIGEHFGVPTFESLEEILHLRPDAVLIAAPDFAHFEVALRCLTTGCHLFCEKPICFVPTDVDRLIEARDKNGRVVQVGYMKRFDISVEAALEEVPANGSALRFVSVEVNEAEAGFHTSHRPFRRFSDLSPELIAEGERSTAEQVERAVGVPLSPVEFRGFITAYCSSLVHEVNTVFAFLDKMGVADYRIVGAEFFADGDGGAGMLALNRGRTVWQMSHFMVPQLADYRERIALYFDYWYLELLFPSPWLAHQQTELRVHRSKGARYEQTFTRIGYQSPYVRELEGFRASIVEGKPVRNTLEHAKRDQEVLCELARAAASDRSS